MAAHVGERRGLNSMMLFRCPSKVFKGWTGPDVTETAPGSACCDSNVLVEPQTQSLRRDAGSVLRREVISLFWESTECTAHFLWPFECSGFPKEGTECCSHMYME